LDVEYLAKPMRMECDSDAPDLPEHCAPILGYIVTQERAEETNATDMASAQLAHVRKQKRILTNNYLNEDAARNIIGAKRRAHGMYTHRVTWRE
jgi:hypothetical protein